MKIHKVRKVTSEKWLNLYVADYENGGHKGHWVFASRREEVVPARIEADAVLIVAILREENQPPRLVLVKEFRVPIGDYVYGLPAGLLEKGEKIEDTARRELLEETGLEVTRITRISPPLLSSSGLTDEAASILFVDARKSPSGAAPEGSEEIEVVLLDYQAVCRLCKNPDLHIDGRAWMVLHQFEQMGRIP